MPTLSSKARQGRLAAIAHLSNRRSAARHFCPARLTLPLFAETASAAAPAGYLLH